ncbi:MAG: TPM domain-containing protein [Clostridia bacterium]|nr:TPM domain-containing protein [Clostridia bacterium]
MKKLFSIVVSLLLVVCLVVPASAETTGYVFDDANVLESEDIAELNQRLSLISSSYNFETYFITGNEQDGKEIKDHLNAACDTYKLGKDDTTKTIILYLSISDDDYMIRTINQEDKVFTNAGLTYIINKIGEEFSAKNYYAVAWKYANMCDGFLDYAQREGTPYEEDTLPEYSAFFMPCVGNQIPHKRILPYFIDEADLVGSYSESELNQKLEKLSKEYQCDIAIVTVDSLGSRTPVEYADDYFDYNGFGYDTTQDGVALIIGMENRDWHITTTGAAIHTFTDYGITYIGDQFVSYLSDGQYADGFNEFADQCASFLSYEDSTGKVYDTNNKVKTPASLEDILKDIGIALIIGLIIGLVLVSRLKAQLKSVRFQPDANNYLRPGSMVLTNQQDLFLYTNVTKTARQSESSGGGSSTHSSSSGSSHGGGGGHF